MPTKLFFELNEDKQKRIIDVSISEFAAYGYTNSSTNRMAKNAEISKGSLFKYFSSKEALYFFILDTVMADFIRSIEKGSSGLSPELFQRVIEYSVLEFSYYIHNPERAKLIIATLTKSDTEIYGKTVKRYDTQELDIFYSQIKDIDISNFRFGKQKTIDILKWFLKGFNENFLETAQIDFDSLEQIQNEYIKSLTEYMEILKTGLWK